MTYRLLKFDLLASPQTRTHAPADTKAGLGETAPESPAPRHQQGAAHDAQLRGRRGEGKATGATRRDLLVAYYYIVRDHVPFRQLGPDWLRRRYSPEHRARRLQLQLEALGYKVTIEATQNQEPQPHQHAPATT